MFGSINNIPAIVESVEVECVEVVHTYKKLQNAEHVALAFSAVLAVDKGVQSKLVKIRRGWRVIADDGRGVDFWQK